MYNILHVDDNDTFLELFRLMVSDVFQVSSVTNPLQTPEILQTIRFDAVVTDYHMPVLNGLDLIRNLKATHPELPVFLYTSQGSEKVVQDAFRAGVSDYFLKDLDTFAHKERVVNSIVNAITRREAIEAARRAEERLRENERNLESLLSTIDKTLITANVDKKIIPVKQAYISPARTALGEVMEKEQSCVVNINIYLNLMNICTFSPRCLLT